MFRKISKYVLLSVLLSLFVVSMPTYAVVNAYRVSAAGGANQIWFEAEDYDERAPDANDAGDEYYLVVPHAGANGKAITRAGGNGGYIKWTFDVSAAGGAGGEWRFWARVINPNNTSDYLVVEGSDDEKIAAALALGVPYPGRPGPFVDGEDRIFEQSQGPPWTWGVNPSAQGHIQVLKDGMNAMYIFGRQGTIDIYWDTFCWTDGAEYVPTDEDYIAATVVEMPPPSAVQPADKLASTWGSMKSAH